MKPFKLGVLGLLCLFTISNANAQTVISAEVRPRAEYSHGVKSLAVPDQDASLSTSQRTRLNAAFSAEKFKLYISLQDVRIWGSQSQLVKNEDYAVSVHQAWGELFFTPEFTVKGGRMELSYDDQRILGAVGWAQQARSHDLVLLKYEKEFNAHVGLAYNEDGNLANNFYSTQNSYKAMQYLWLNKKWEHINISVLFLNNGMPYAISSDNNGNLIKQGIRYSLTAGGRAVVHIIDQLDVEASLYSQTGSDPTGKGLSAYQFLINAIVKPTKTLTLTAGYELLSGTDYTETGKNNSFNPLYGTNHKFNGLMDYFYVGNHLNNVGLNDIYLKGSLKLGDVVLGLHAHNFSAAADIAENTDKGLGTEIDLNCSYKFTKAVGISGGYSQMFATESMEVLKGGDRSQTNNWAWLMVTINPTLFNSENK